MARCTTKYVFCLLSCRERHQLEAYELMGAMGAMRANRPSMKTRPGLLLQVLRPVWEQKSTQQASSAHKRGTQTRGPRTSLKPLPNCDGAPVPSKRSPCPSPRATKTRQNTPLLWSGGRIKRGNCTRGRRRCPWRWGRRAWGRRRRTWPCTPRGRGCWRPCTPR